MAKRNEYKTMPSAVAQRSGCKVGWMYYLTKEDAEAAAKIARHNAAIAARNGYDFGFCCPGSVTQVNGGEYDGMWEVCVS